MKDYNKFKLNEDHLDFNSDEWITTNLKKGDTIEKYYTIDTDGGPIQNEQPNFNGKVIATFKIDNILKDTKLSSKKLSDILKKSELGNPYSKYLRQYKLDLPDGDNVGEMGTWWDFFDMEIGYTSDDKMVIIKNGKGSEWDYIVASEEEIAIPKPESYSVVVDIEGYAVHVPAEGLSEEEAIKYAKQVSETIKIEVVKGDQIHGKRTGVVG